MLGGLAFTACRLVGQIPLDDKTLWAAAGGAGAYVLIEIIFRKPLGLYVFGHELSHALTALAFGHKVKSLRVSAKGGEVALSGTNVWVALAPYLFPIFTLAAAGLLLLLRHYGGGHLSPAWLAAAVGLTFAFHVSLTVHAIAQDQPDLRHAGTFLSLVMILMSNLLIFVLLLKLLFPEIVSLKNFFAGAAVGTLDLLDRIIGWIGQGAHFLARSAGGR